MWTWAGGRPGGLGGREIVVLAEVTGQALPAEGVEAAAAFGLAAPGQRR